MPRSETDATPMRRMKLGLAAIGLLVLGGVAGGAISHEFRPPIAMAPMHVVAIHNLAAANGIVTIKGRVAESFGSRLVIDDGTGRTLVDTGPRNDGDALAPLGATVSVQGRFDRDAFRPAYLVDATGTVTPIGPPDHHGGGHGHPGFGPGGEHEPDDGRGPGDGRKPDDGRGPDRGPPPPPPAPAADATAAH